MTKTTCRSNLIQPYDIFFYSNAENNNKSNHYFVCIYAQLFDNKTKLKQNIYGLMITTNEMYKTLNKKEYYVEIEINGTPCFVLCDTLLHISISDVTRKIEKVLTRQEKGRICRGVKKFTYSIKHQAERNVEIE